MAAMLAQVLNKHSAAPGFALESGCKHSPSQPLASAVPQSLSPLSLRVRCHAAKARAAAANPYAIHACGPEWIFHPFHTAKAAAKSITNPRT